MTRLARALLALGALLPLPACGGDEATPALPWSSARVEGIPDASDLCAAGEELLAVSGGGSRQVFAVARKALVPAARAFARPVPVDTLADPFVSGSDELAAHGYRLSDLWSQDVDLQGIAFLPPDLLYLGDRRYRVVYQGFVERDGAGRIVRLVLQRVFAVPGAERPGRERSDWRDASPGLSGLAARPPEDVLVVERASTKAGEFRLVAVDKLGIALEGATFLLPPGAAADVGGMAWDDDRGVVLNGPGAGALLSVPRPRPGGRVVVGPGEQGPAIGGVGPWRGIARTPDGVTWLVSGGPGTRVAWR